MCDLCSDVMLLSQPPHDPQLGALRMQQLRSASDPDCQHARRTRLPGGGEVLHNGTVIMGGNTSALGPGTVSLIICKVGASPLTPNPDPNLGPRLNLEPSPSPGPDPDTAPHPNLALIMPAARLEGPRREALHARLEIRDRQRVEILA